MEGNLVNKDKINERGELEPDHFKSIIRQLIDGLEQLTLAGRCHNDLKPANILYKIVNVTEDSEVCVKNSIKHKSYNIIYHYKKKGR